MVTALLLSGGTGTRMGVETPKQYIEVNGRPIISYCLERLLAHEGIDAVQIVADEAWRETILNCMENMRREEDYGAALEKKGRGRGACPGFSGGGRNRQRSALDGL